MPKFMMNFGTCYLLHMWIPWDLIYNETLLPFLKLSTCPFFKDYGSHAEIRNGSVLINCKYGPSFWKPVFFFEGFGPLRAFRVWFRLRSKRWVLRPLHLIRVSSFLPYRTGSAVFTSHDLQNACLTSHLFTSPVRSLFISFNSGINVICIQSSSESYIYLRFDSMLDPHNHYHLIIF